MCSPGSDLLKYCAVGLQGSQPQSLDKGERRDLTPVWPEAFPGGMGTSRGLRS